MVFGHASFCSAANDWRGYSVLVIHLNPKLQMFHKNTHKQTASITEIAVWIIYCLILVACKKHNICFCALVKGE